MRGLLLVALLVGDPGAWQLTAELPAGSMPWGIAVHGEVVHVAHVGYKGRDNVWRYEGARVTAKSGFAGHAVELDVSKDGKVVYAANSRRDEVLALDAVDLRVLRRYPTGRAPKDLILSPDGTRLYVGNFGERTVSVIDLAGGETRTVRVGDGPRGVDVTRDGKKLYVASLRSGTVSVIDTATLRVTATIETCRGAAHTAFTPGDQLLLVTCYGASHLAVIDVASDRKLREVRVERGPNPVRVTPDGRQALVGNEFADSVSVVDLASWEVESFAVPVDRPVGLQLGEDGRRFYLSGRGSAKLLVYERAIRSGGPAR